MESAGSKTRSLASGLKEAVDLAKEEGCYYYIEDIEASFEEFKELEGGEVRIFESDSPGHLLKVFDFTRTKTSPAHVLNGDAQLQRESGKTQIVLRPENLRIVS